MAFAWRSSGISYLKYSQICAQAVRNALKADLKPAAQIRDEQGIKFAKWQDGKASENVFLETPKAEKN
ncbi:hypothetical protein DSO57_1004430 [Entomophthora muscae]|uniref:Uncharacterized protein n=2 Tax=Entomophthora muscae TaxID=34485 RepID=A0ACC2TH88_9FUNG|nr:hypothetical protein DSO57_1014233 [Entomophthora muscae]KAJ9074628.1 hypothetical protein DSO57_1004430 [Entomophthora muscae]